MIYSRCDTDERIAIYENGDIDAYVTTPYTVPTGSAGIVSTPGWILGEDIGPRLYDLRGQIAIPLFLTAIPTRGGTIKHNLIFANITGTMQPHVYQISHQEALGALLKIFETNVNDFVSQYGGQTFTVSQTVHTRIPFLMDRLS